jgi:hypothetical protein
MGRCSLVGVAHVRRDPEAAGAMINFYKTIAAMSVIAVVGCFIWHMARETSYANNWPKSPQPELARTIPHAARRSITVYISRDDNRRDLMIQIILLAACLSALAFSGLSGDLKQYLSPDASSK